MADYADSDVVELADLIVDAINGGARTYRDTLARAILDAGWRRETQATVAEWGEERYCVESGRPVHLIPGDRCLAHGAAATMCTTTLRAPQCRHERQSPNHPYPHCSECGADSPPIGPCGHDGCNHQRGHSWQDGSDRG